MESKTDDLYGHDIPKRLQKANTKLKSLVTLYDKDIIKSNISKYTYRNLGHDSSETDIISDLNSNQLLDQKYSLQLEVLKKLWIINGLVNELSPLKTLKDTDGSETQSDDNQNNSSINFSHAVYNYIKLKLKVSELVAYLKTGNFMGNSISEKDINEIRILSDLESNINEFESRIFVLIQIQFKKFIKIDNEEVSVVFSPSVDDYEFNDFLSECYDFISSSNSFDSSDEDSVSNLFNFNKSFVEWISNAYDEKINKSFIANFNEKGTEISINFSESDNRNLKDFNFEGTLNSTENIVNFFDKLTNLIKTENANVNPSSKLKRFILKPIMKNLKHQLFDERNNENIYEIIINNLNNDTNNSSIETNIYKKLKKLSSLLSENGWSSSGYSDIEFWIDDIINYWIGNHVAKALNSVKTLCLDLKLSREGKSDKFKNIFKELEIVYFKNDNVQAEKQPEQQQQQQAIQMDIKTTHKPEDKKDDWNSKWTDDEDDEDGWGDEVEIEDDDEEIVKNSTKAEEIKDTGSEDKEDQDDDWDAWNEEDDWNVDDKTGKLNNKPESDSSDLGVVSLSTGKTESPASTSQILPEAKNASSSNEYYKTTKVVKLLLEIFDNFFIKYKELASNGKIKSTEQLKDVEELFYNEFNKICLCFFMIISQDVTKFYLNEILFFNDFCFLLDSLKDKFNDSLYLNDCYKLNNQTIDKIIINNKNELYNILKPYRSYLFSDDSTRFPDDVLKSETDKLLNETKQFLQDNLFKRYHDNLDEFEINKQLNSTIIANIISTYHSFIIMKLLYRKTIGDEESLILANFIQATLSYSLPTAISKHGNSDGIAKQLGKIQTYNKLDQIRIVLSSSLKEISNHFYDAVFYDLDTQELIGLICALFIDSPTRREVIEDIKSIREEADS
ncbi:hypothetical protein B5S28_g271 [[Candida] boidinii]|nr:hypothetical protein B5S28_g271 [[Candida] boidinii]